MLTELRIRDFAVIEDVALEFGAGFNVLSGETGAGKSIIVDALTAVLGARMTVDVIRARAPSAHVEARFTVERGGPVAGWLGAQGFEIDELAAAREIGAEGRSRAWINGRPATVGMLRELGDRLVEVAGQHEGTRLLQAPVHRELLDAYGGAAVLSLRDEVARLVEARAALRREQQELIDGARDREREIDALRHQIAEIDGARLQPGEEETLEVRRTRLAHAERLAAAAAAAYAALYDSDGQAAVDRLGHARGALREASALDPTLAEVVTRVDSLAADLAEVAHHLADYLHAIEARPDELEAVQDRLALLRSLRRKYGASIDDVLASRAQAAARLAGLDAHDERVGKVTADLDAAERTLVARCGQLSELRRAAAQRLQSGVERTLHSLEMKRARFIVELTREPDPDGLPVDGGRVTLWSTGVDRVEFLLGANPGEGPRPLARVASGGELSRVMLALRHVLAEAGAVPIMVCDEVDAGIGAMTAGVVGQLLASVSRTRQVLCVTHIAQIASLADRHVRVTKDATGSRTRVEAKMLDPKERVEEVARLLGGRMPTSIAREYAAELLSQARRKKTAAAEAKSGGGGKP